MLVNMDIVTIKLFKRKWNLHSAGGDLLPLHVAGGQSLLPENYSHGDVTISKAGCAGDGQDHQDTNERLPKRKNWRTGTIQ